MNSLHRRHTLFLGRLSRLAATSDLPTLFGRSFSFTPKRHTFESQGKFRSEAEGSSADAEDGTKCRVDNALSIYLEGIKEQKRVMEEHKAAFEVGKRHIANIMGLDPEHLTQADVDEAIQYLFPTGLFDPKVKPVMKPPEEIFPPIITVELNADQRPADSLFFTARPKFYRILSEINAMTQSLIYDYDAKALEAFKSGRGQFTYDVDKAAHEKFQTLLSSTGWLTSEKLSDKLLENVKDDQHANLVLAFENLIRMPVSYKYIDFVSQYRDPLTGGADDNSGTGTKKLFFYKLPEVQTNEAGERFATANARVKRTNLTATVVDRPGRYMINGEHIDVFQTLLAREVMLCPLIICDLLGKLDIDARQIDGPGGQLSMPQAVRTAVSLCIASLYPKEHSEKLRLGLLTFDPRKRERSKINQPGARAKWIWLRR